MRVALLCVCLAMVAGCGFVDDLSEMFEQRSQLQALIQKEQGWEVQVGFQNVNGTLVHVTVSFDAEDVSDKSVTDLMMIARTSAVKVFEETPENVIVQVVSSEQAIEQ